MGPFRQIMGAVRALPSKFGRRSGPCQIIALPEQPVKVCGPPGPLLTPPASVPRKSHRRRGGTWKAGNCRNFLSERSVTVCEVCVVHRLNGADPAQPLDQRPCRPTRVLCTLICSLSSLSRILANFATTTATLPRGAASGFRLPPGAAAGSPAPWAAHQ